MQTPEQRREICRLAGIARARAFTPEYQRATRARLPREAAARGGRITYAKLCQRLGPDAALQHLADYRRAHPSALERTVITWLDQHHYPYERECRINGIWVDFVLTGTRTIIEVDGERWHTLHPLHRQDRQSRDLVHGMALATAGYDVIRLPERTIKDGTFADILRDNL